MNCELMETKWFLGLEGPIFSLNYGAYWLEEVGILSFINQSKLYIPSTLNADHDFRVETCNERDV